MTLKEATKSAFTILKQVIILTMNCQIFHLWSKSSSMNAHVPHDIVTSPFCRLWKRSWMRQTWKRREWHPRVASSWSRARSWSRSSRSWPEFSFVLLLTSNAILFMPVSTKSLLLCVRGLNFNQFLTFSLMKQTNIPCENKLVIQIPKCRAIADSLCPWVWFR